MTKQHAVIIGGGIGGLATANLLAKSGYQVTLIEKNQQLGGRANFFTADGFRFDMGPSWYLMPDVFKHYFDLIDEPVEQQLELNRLDPSYRIKFRGTNRTVDMRSDLNSDAETFESIEAGSGQKLKDYVEKSKYQYDVAIRSFMYKNYDTVFDFLNRQTAVEGRRLHVFEKMHTYVSRFFKTDELQKIMEYQLVFLGSSPYNTPALYNIMSHIDFNMGVFYPEGGIYSIIERLVAIGKNSGVTYITGDPAAKIQVEGGLAKAVKLASGQVITADLVISNADIHHTETALLPSGYRDHSDRYWSKRTLAPSAFIMYLGVNRKLPQLVHHNLAFGADWRKGFSEIFDKPQWPTDPSYYICSPSQTDPSTAPDGHENLFVLVPTAPGLEATEDMLQTYRTKVLQLLKDDFDLPDIEDHIVFERIYSSDDFQKDYNAFGGSALGLAHTLRQTAIFRPNNVSRKVKNLYYVGGGTNPGIGMPICLISAELVYKRIMGDTSAGPLPKLLA